MKKSSSLILSLAVLAGVAAHASADEIVFVNGDRLTGKIVSANAGKLVVATDVAGEVTIDMSKVQSFTTDEPVTVYTEEGAEVQTTQVGGEAPAVAPEASAEAAPAPVTVSSIKSINPPPPSQPKWTGSVTAGIAGANGNSKNFSASASAAAELRRADDRFTLGGHYLFKRQEDVGTGTKSTTEDEWLARGKYDRFLTDQLYAFFSMTVERDRLANLDYRLNPTVGVGYQWYEQPDFNFNTEAGLGYIYNKYRDGDTDETVALRFAYHLDKQLTDTLSLFHNVEYLPSVEDLGDFLVRADLGVRADLTSSFFTEAKIMWEHDSQPATGARKDDVKYLLGVGWKF